MGSNTNAALLLIENVIARDSHPMRPIQLGLDLNMMAITSGRERTKAEYVALLESSGYTISRVVPTRSTFSIIEARPNRQI
jgi:hypothetical protein